MNFIKIFKPGDYLLIIIIFFFIFIINSWKNPYIIPKTISIKISENFYYSYSLNKNREIEIPVSDGKVIIKIQDNKAWIKETDCPNKICKKMGKIKNIGDVIICLPNHLVITIEGNNSELDGITM